MKKNRHKHQCEICKEKFNLKDLYPIALLRESVKKTFKEDYPDHNEKGYLCLPDSRRVNAQYFKGFILKERGKLSALEEEVLESLKDQDVLAENPNLEYEQTLTIGEKIADKMARFGGSWYFIFIFVTTILGWMFLNASQFFTDAFDPYPFILLNLVLSCLAAFQAPIIMMSQNRQAEKDRIKMDEDYMVNLKAELQIRQINAKLELFMKQTFENMYELFQLFEEKSEIKK